MWKKCKMYLSMLLAVALVIPQGWNVPQAQAAAIGETVLTSDFDTGVDGWMKRGSETAAQSTETAHSGTGSLKVTGRTANWNGPGTYLDSLTPGATYEFSIYALLLAGTTGDAQVSMTVHQEGLPANDPETYKNVNSQQGSTANWVELKGNLTLDPRATRYQLYVESSNATASYYVDSFKVKLVSLPATGSAPPESPTPPTPTAPITESGSTVTVVVNQGFENDAIGGWERLSWGGAGTVAVTSEQASAGTKSLKFSSRAAANSALSLDVTPMMQSDRKYDLSFKLRLSEGTDQIHLASKLTSAGTDSYPWVIGNKEVSSTAWTTFEIKGYEVPSNTTAFRVYVEGTATLADFYLDEFVITDVTPAPSTVVLEQGFENDAIGGWERLSWGGAGTVAVTSEQASAGTKSLKFSGRAAANSALSLDVTTLMTSDRKYDVSFKLRLSEGTDQIHLASKMTSAGTDSYPWVIGNKEVTSTGWTTFEIKGYEVPSNTTAFRVYIEASASTADLYLDEVKIVDVTPGGNTQQPGNLDQSGITASFEDGQGDWERRFGDGMIEVTNAANHTTDGSKSLLTTASAQYDGPLLNVLGKMHKNHEYSLSAWVKMAPGEEPTRLRLSVQSGESTFTNVSSNETVTDSAWVQLSGKFTLRTNATVLNAYVETADDNGEPRAFYMDDFSLTHVGAVEGPLPVQTNIDSLKELYADYFEIGAAVEPAQFSGTADQLLKKHYNSIVAENSMKPASMNSTAGTYNYTSADTIVKYAQDNNMKLRFHTLLWHEQGADWMLKDEQGSWLEATPENKDLVLSRLRTYISTVVTKYADVTDYYDVVNEVIDEGRPDGMRNSHWYRITGLDFIRVAFEEARKADPTAKLYINDYSTHNPQKRDFLFNLVTKLKAEGVPIDGVGHQTHINVSGPSIQLISDSIRKFGEAGFDNQLTELDISVYTNNSTSYDPIPEEVLIKQGYRYKELFEELVKLDEMGKNANPASPAYKADGWISNVTIWGIADDHTWLHNRGTTRQDAPFPFDKRHQAKLAYWGMVEAVKVITPSKLPIVSKAGTAAQGTPVVDGLSDAVWDTVAAIETEKTNVFGASFKTLWDADRLFVWVNVKDAVKTVEDQIEFFTNEGGTITKYVITRNAQHHVVETEGGYTVEAELPISGNSIGKQLAFDLRITTGGAQDGTEHGQNGAIVSWSDSRNLQHLDTAGYGKLTLVGVPKSANAVKGTPVIDGEADALWNTASELETAAWVQGTSGATAKFKTLWDEQHLYVYAVVTDSLLSDTSDDPWQEDSVEIFVDQNNGKSATYQSDDGQYRINFKNVKTVGGHASHENYTSVTKLVYGVGYVVEAAIKLDTITPAVGTVIGFDLQINNDQNGDGTRDSVVNWADPSGQSYQDTSKFGVLRFVAAPTSPSSPPGTPTETPKKQETSIQDGKIKPPVKMDNGNAKAVVTKGDLEKALQKADSDKLGRKKATIELEIQPGAVAYGLELPTSSLTGDSSLVLQVKTPVGVVELPSNMLSNTNGSGMENVKLQVEKGNVDKLEATVREQIGNRPVIALHLMNGDDVVPWSNPKAPVTVSIPYTPTEEERKALGNIVVWYVDRDGKASSVPSGRYDETTGSVTFKTTHFSTYAVVHVEKSFSDIESYSWAATAIKAMASRDVIQGTSSSAFDPSANIKRADFLLLLVRALGLQSEGGSAFTDVSAEDYYYDAVRIAKQLGIAKGEGSGRFQPQASITRQEMMVLTARALITAGQPLEAAASLSQFSDAASVADYARDSASALAAAGIVNGIGGEIQPKGLLTRAEAAVILYRVMGME